MQSLKLVKLLAQCEQTQHCWPTIRAVVIFRTAVANKDSPVTFPQYLIVSPLASHFDHLYNQKSSAVHNRFYGLRPLMKTLSIHLHLALITLFKEEEMGSITLHIKRVELLR